MTDAIAMFDGAPEAGAIAPLQSTAERTPYVVFFSAKSKNAPAVISKLGQVPDGTPVLLRPDGSMERLDAMKFWLSPMHLQYHAVIDDQNAVQEATFEKPGYGDGKRWTEHVDAVILILTHRGIEPARLTFRSTKCPAAHDMVNEIIRAGGEDWAKESNDNSAAVSAIGKPWLRVRGVITLEAKKGKKPPFRDYVQANAHVKATSAGDYQAIVAAQADEDFRGTLQGCADDHNKRIADVKAKVR